MNSPRQYTDCGGELEMGFVPDVSVTVAQQSSWHRGEHDKTSRSSSGDFDYTWAMFEGMPEFWTRAAEAGRAVVFTVDL